VQREHPHRAIKIMQQTGKGKGDAVRLGFAAASGDILMILDADLTMPPEDLPKFYELLATGHGEFANGVRLVYPMDEKAMQFLNLCANKAFGLIFTWLLGQPVKDTLCGTKVLRRAHYERSPPTGPTSATSTPSATSICSSAPPSSTCRSWTCPSATRSAPTARPTSSAGSTAGSCCAWCCSPPAS
jgi:hypothetical protein